MMSDIRVHKRSRNGGSTRQVKRQKRMFRGRLARPRKNHVELKFLDVDLDDALIASAGTVTPSIIIIAQGVTESTRVGRKCTIRRIGWRYNLFLATQAALTNGTEVVRLILYVDKQANGATAAVTDILETADFQSFNNLSNSGRFRILMDRTHDVVSPGGAGDGANNDSSPASVSAQFFKELSLPVEYSGANGTIDEIKSNNIGVLAIARGGTVELFSKFRMRFGDA